MDINEIVYGSYLRARQYFGDDLSDEKRRSPDILLPLLAKYPKRNTVVVTGSKGKGSIARMIAALCSERGKTGLFVSPHVRAFEDRISVDGIPIEEKKLNALLEGVWREVRPYEESLGEGEYLSPIGILSLAACNYFKEQDAKYSVFECGRGAKCDDVNRIPHEYAAIGRIFLEHTRELGRDLLSIAKHKAFVMTKDTKAAFSVSQEPEVLSFLEEFADSVGTKLYVYGRDFGPDGISEGDLSLKGSYQIEHAALSMSLCNMICKEEGLSPVNKRPLGSVRIPGRLEVLSEDPFFLVDACINRESAAEVISFLEKRGINKAGFLLCLSDDKDLEGVAKAISPAAEEIILTRIEHPHYPMTSEQKERIEKTGLFPRSIPSLSMAMSDAIDRGLPVVALCSNIFVSEIEDAWKVLAGGG